MDVLIIDDDLSICNYLREIVSGEGHHCYVAHNHKEAFEILDHYEVDLALIDVYLPEKDGFQITKTIRKVYGATWIPVVFISASDSDKDYEKCVEAGGDDYLVKPIRPIVVKTKLKTLERISSMKRRVESANKKLKRLTHLDPLTKVQNRRSLQHVLLKEWRSAKRNRAALSVLMIDIDCFKSYNDSLRHLKGDTCLQKVAKVITHTVTRPRDVVSRYGGEEFLVVLPETNLEGANCIAENIHQAILDKGISHPNSEISNMVTVSIGVSCITDRTQSPEHLCDEADQALYQAKRDGRNRSCLFRHNQ
ncbi:diguanylate cyclase [Neptuniibacter sp.]|uniref:GGDEF domain-containing response regulator n=1 Tax=Neptuniibacter sp. TaxID=1962643 RepID=UPI002631D3DB|nr:diguanylate cyclase [Neptuniibacter sp.]MCP4597124.1 diguanylate cyclase [Neptuniibacter sp.]